MKRDGEIVKDQLLEGNQGAQGYFERRVDLMLRSETDADRLHEFLRHWWPSYKTGARKRRALQQTPGA